MIAFSGATRLPDWAGPMTMAAWLKSVPTLTDCQAHMRLTLKPQLNQSGASDRRNQPV